MHQTGLAQKLQRSVNRGRLDGACIALGKSLQQVIGTHRAVTGPHQFQYAAPQRRELEAAGGANLLGSRKRIGDAMVVVVPAATVVSFGAARPSTVKPPPSQPLDEAAWAAAQSVGEFRQVEPLTLAVPQWPVRARWLARVSARRLRRASIASRWSGDGFFRTQ